MGTFSMKLGDLLGKGKEEGLRVEGKKEGLKVINSDLSKKREKKTREVSMSTKGNVNIQDQFLNHMRREKAPVTVHLTDGKEVHGHIKSFDNFCIQLESQASGETLIYKHGISTITPSKISDYKKG